MIEEKLESLTGRQAKILGHEECYKSAVLLPLLQYQGELCVLFEKRAQNLNSQPGEICFPGGSIEDYDHGEKEAAIRESCEELNIEAADINILAPLDIFVSPLNVIVYPFLAYIKRPEKIAANADEVQYVFYVPVKHLLQSQPLSTSLSVSFTFPEDYPYELVPQGRDYPYPKGKFSQKFFFWQNEIIWGLTARILNHFLNLLKKP